jgi:alpha-L-fucosidase
MKHHLIRILSVLLATTAFSGAERQADRDTRMAWWREARFGMFVHWGLYSGLTGNWKGQRVENDSILIPRKMKVDTNEYAKAAIPLFQPKQGFAREWAKLAKAAGCRYMVLTTKHHDGFALHDSKAGDFDAGSVLQRDLVREFVDACRAEGLRVGFYHSLIDWHHDQYEYNRSTLLHHPLKGQPYPNGARNHAKYVEYLHAQVNELVSNYGQVDVMWFDYSAPDFQGQETWRAFDLMKMVREKQPGIIINNRLFRCEQAGWNPQTGASGNTLDTRFGDFITPEQHIPAGGMSTVDWETCMTLNDVWGYSEHDKNWKSSTTLIRKLIDIASKGGNYLLNIGPKGDGSIPQESVQSFTRIGQWMETNAEAIHGTTTSPLEKTPFDGRLTTKGKINYAHLFSRPDSGAIEVPFPIQQATLLADGSRLDVISNKTSTTIKLPAKLPDADATVIRLE